MTRSLRQTRMLAMLQATVRNTLFDGTDVEATIKANIAEEIASGTGFGAANRAWQWRHSETAPKKIEENEDFVIDLYDFDGLDAGSGSGSDPVGMSLVLHEVILILIKNENAAEEEGVLNISPDDTGGWDPIGDHTGDKGLRSGGCFMIYQPAEGGFPVSDTTSHRIKLSATGGDVNFSIWVLGRYND